MTQSGSNLSHSILSASASARWVTCPASGFWNAVLPSASAGMAARKGTGIHSLLEIALNTNKEADDFDYVPIPDAAGVAHNEPITEEQRDVLQKALDYIRMVANGEPVQTEKCYFYGEELGVPDENAFGTGDATVIEKNPFGGYTLHIMDLKTGRVPVSAERNTQLALYATGALRENDLVYDFNEVVLHIIQPRVSGGTHSWSTTPTEIREMTKAMQPSAKRIIELVQQRDIDGIEFRPSADCYEPSDNCTFCKAAALPCAAQADKAHQVLADMFEEAELGGQVPTKTADEFQDYEIGDVLAVADILEPFFKAVREEAMRRAVAGGEVKGYKVVRSQAGRKSWKADVNVLQELAKIAPGINFTRPAEPRTVSDVLKMDVFKSKRGDSAEDKEHKALLAAQVADLYEQAEDSKSLVPLSDPRETWQPKVSTADDFEDLA